MQQNLTKLVLASLFKKPRVYTIFTKINDLS